MSELNDAPIRRTATNILNNDYVFAVVAIMAFAYAQRAAPPLPDWLIQTFSINWVRVLFLSLLLVFRFETRPTVAIIIALTFVFILQRIHIQEAKEGFEIIQNAKRQMRKNMKRRQKKRKHKPRRQSTCFNTESMISCGSKKT